MPPERQPTAAVRQSTRPHLRSFFGLTAVTVLSGCSGGVLDPRGPIADANAQILLNALEIMLVIVVPTILAALAFAWWFRASNARARYRPEWVYSGRIELIVWAIPLLVILFLGGEIWIGAHELDPFRPIEPQDKALEVQVVSLDWKWLFIYPEQGVASVNEIVIPVDTPVHFSLTSASVMNMFFVPQLGSMIATMNGMVTQLHLKADHAGSFFGQSAQFSGDGFSGMHFTLHAVEQPEFDQWIAAARQTGPALDLEAYVALAQQSENVPPHTYREVEPMLFRDLVTQQLPPGPGPASGSSRPVFRPQERTQ
ncbi:MAG: ubiquinol oxidase subunit II [Xanthobacteraceae bacterium]|nr:ubiquinol oxidase subunit II [Xanthobacteraceae bacterium]